MKPEAIEHLARCRAVADAFSVEFEIGEASLLAYSKGSYLGRVSEYIGAMIGVRNAREWNGFSPGSLVVRSVETRRLQESMRTIARFYFDVDLTCGGGSEMIMYDFGRLNVLEVA